MRSEQPPCVAKWLLRHFGSSPNNAALIGDLDERYRYSRNRFWYWRQVVWAIVASFFKEISGHKALAIRALIIGWTIKAAWLSAFWYVYGAPPRRLFTAGIEPLLFVFLMGIIAMMSTTWIIAKTHPVHYRPIVLLYLLLELIGPFLTFISKGVLGGYDWRYPAILQGVWPPLFQVIYEIQFHLGIFNGVAATWESAVIMVVSILVGGGFLRNEVDSNSAEHPPATT